MYTFISACVSGGDTVSHYVGSVSYFYFIPTILLLVEYRGERNTKMFLLLVNL